MMALTEIRFITLIGWIFYQRWFAWEVEECAQVKP